MKTRYRPEIDGLRAVAVLPVILFHAGFAPFAGGFVGVDVFFVISGYLITGIIHDEIVTGNFSLIRFYERRARRILPALFVVCLASFIAAWWWMLPSEFLAFSQSLMAVCAFASNFLFWQQSGYFESAVELKPLLHTWSLAVEEQFYVLFPLLLLTCRRWRSAALLVAITITSVASFALAEWASSAHPDANFYLLPTRAWELGAGALLALTATRWNSLGRLPAELGGVIGLSLIGLAVGALDHATPFPGRWALLPVVGTVLIIACARPTTLVGRLLAHCALVGIGLISYSAYLWHQPLFAFARLRLLDGVHPGDYLLLSAASLVLAWLSWRYIEKPFRSRVTFGRTRIFQLSGAGSMALFAIGFGGYVSDGLPQRQGSAVEIADVEARLSPNYGLSTSCETRFTLAPECRTSATPEVLVWGDSYAMHLVDGILASQPAAGLIQMTKSACGPILDVAPITDATYNAAWAAQCIAFNNQVKGWLESNDSVRYAVLASPFRGYVGPGTRILHGTRTITEGRDIVERQLRETLDWLQARGIRPVVVAPPPRDGRDIGLCLARSTWLGLSATDCSPRLARFKEDDREVLALLETIERDYRVLWLSDMLCDDRRCASTQGEVLIYRDAGHLSREGSRLLGRKYDWASLIRKP